MTISLPDSALAFPKERKMPLNDPGHVRNASARFNEVGGVSRSENPAARRKIETAAQKQGMELKKRPD